jgi:PAS domain-containing protein
LSDLGRSRHLPSSKISSIGRERTQIAPFSPASGLVNLSIKELASRRSGGSRVKRFICEQNIAHFDKLLSRAADATVRRTLEALLFSAKRELALIDSAERGTDALRLEDRQAAIDASEMRDQLRAEFDSSPHPYMLVDPGPGLRIIDINDAYAAATFVVRGDVVGKSLFDVFPDNPANSLADGVSNLYASLKIVAQTGQPHAMVIQRYDIRDPTGRFVERHWLPINRPVRDSNGHLVFLLHHVEDVTEQVLSVVRCEEGADDPGSLS